jgi:hypothetical protein
MTVKIYDFNKEKIRRCSEWTISSNGVIGIRLPKLTGNVKPNFNPFNPIDMSMFDNEDTVDITHKHK